MPLNFSKHSRREGEFAAELARKSIHVLIAFVPSLALLDRSHTALLLMGGIFFYFWAESMRFLGFQLPLVSRITELVSRKREFGHFVLGPVTLGLGALLSILFFPPKVAALAIYALAFGDGISSLVGKFLGRLRPAFLAGKSLEGSIACFAATFLTAFFVSGKWETALAVGLVSTITDALPIREFDNILLPLAAGLAALLI